MSGLPGGVRRLIAPNPGPMTAQGTNTWLVGERQVAVIDPGPESGPHVAAILEAVGPGRVAAILVTHAHRDHSGAVPALAEATGAPVLAFGPARAGRSAAMARLAERGDLAGGEGIDAAFAPTRCLAHGEAVEGDEWRLTALHTPGHLSSHLSFVLEGRDAIFTGDTVMGWSSTLISPPDGSVAAFLDSMALLAARPERVYLPGHGDPVPEGPATARAQAAHRAERAAQIRAALAEGPRDLGALTAAIYRDVAPHLHGAASRNVLAHLIDFAESGEVALPSGPLAEGVFRLRG